MAHSSEQPNGAGRPTPALIRKTRLSAGKTQRPRLPGSRVSPTLLAVALTAGLFGIILGVLVPGYWINDDVKVAWLLAGYPGAGGPSPFAVYSNVLLGLALLPLFTRAGSQNWFAIFLELTNALAAAAMLYVAISAARLSRFRLLGALLVLLSMALFVLEVTFTISAFLASLAGICLLWASTQHEAPSRGEAVIGVALVVLGGLVRLQMLLVAAAVAVPTLVVSGNGFRRLVVPLLTAGVLVSAGYGFDRLYVRTRPDWNKFYAYTQVRQKVHDTHRLNNVHGQIRRIGWTPNDQELFARWHYPDEDLYSYEHLRYLQIHVSPFSQDIGATLLAWLPGITGGRNTAYLVLMIGNLFLSTGLGLGLRRHLAIAGSLVMALGINALLVIGYKNPTYVQACTLAAAVFLSAFLLGQPLGHRRAPDNAGLRGHRLQRSFSILGLAVILVGGALELQTVWAISRNNSQRRNEYSVIRSELLDLERDGIVPPNSLIISPTHGLPYYWSNPFELDRPVPAFLDTGWITFSPAYKATLRHFEISSIPEALVSRHDVFLMTQEAFTPFLSRYYDEHYSLKVEFAPLYSLPNPSGWPEFDRLFIYRVKSAGPRVDALAHP